jgi:hypothetical protein
MNKLQLTYKNDLININNRMVIAEEGFAIIYRRFFQVLGAR